MDFDKEILIVDDCNTTRKLLTYMIKGKGHKVVVAENGIEALEKMNQNTIGLIVTDLNMPQMDGFELVDNVRKEGPCSNIPIIMVTTEAGDANKDKAEELGINTYFVKPVTVEELMQEVEKYLV